MCASTKKADGAGPTFLKVHIFAEPGSKAVRRRNLAGQNDSSESVVYVMVRDFHRKANDSPCLL
jgi:hypothetical protein